MTAGEVTSMPDDTELIVFANRPPIKAKKAFQFELFPKPEILLNQSEYEKNTNPKQIERLEELQKQFEVDIENKIQQQKERLAEIKKQEEETRKLKEQKEKEEQKRKKDEALRMTAQEFGEPKEE